MHQQSALLAALFTASCSTDTISATTNSTESWLAEYELDGLEGREIIEHLDAMPVADRLEGLIASVEPDPLVLFDGEGKESSIPLPENEVYLSLAPCLQQTHDCHFHSLTTCLGGLRGQEIDITVTDCNNDAVVFGDTGRTYDNGFVGLWLPRVTGTLNVTQGDRSASVPIATALDAPTCITTLQLTWRSQGDKRSAASCPTHTPHQNCWSKLSRTKASSASSEYRAKRTSISSKRSAAPVSN